MAKRELGAPSGGEGTEQIPHEPRDLARVANSNRAPPSRLETLEGELREWSERALVACVSAWHASDNDHYFQELARRKAQLAREIQRAIGTILACSEREAGESRDILLVRSAIDLSGDKVALALFERGIESPYGTHDFQAIFADLAARFERYSTLKDMATLEGILKEARESGAFESHHELDQAIASFQAKAQLQAAYTQRGGYFKERRTFKAPAEAKPPEYAIEGLFHKKTFIFFAGDSGTGKTTALIQLAISTLTGADFLGHACKRTGPVVLIQTEMHDDFFLKTIENIALGLSINTEAETAHPYKYVYDPSLNLRNRNMADMVERETVEYKPALVMIDSFSGVSDGDNNSDEACKPVVDFCLRLRDKLDALIVMIDHVPKPSRDVRKRQYEPPTLYWIKGATIKTQKADSVLLAVSELNSEVIRFEMVKQRYGLRPKPFWAAIQGDPTGVRKFECCEAPKKGSGPIIPEEEEKEISADLTVLDYIYRFPGRSQAVICDALGGRKQSYKAIFLRLENKDLAVYKTGSRKAKLWTATSKGALLLTSSHQFPPVPGTVDSMTGTGSREYRRDSRNREPVNQGGRTGAPEPEPVEETQGEFPLESVSDVSDEPDEPEETYGAQES